MRVLMKPVLLLVLIHLGTPLARSDSATSTCHDYSPDSNTVISDCFIGGPSFFAGPWVYSVVTAPMGSQIVFSGFTDSTPFQIPMTITYYNLPVIPPNSVITEADFNFLAPPYVGGVDGPYFVTANPVQSLCEGGPCPFTPASIHTYEYEFYGGIDDDTLFINSMQIGQTQVTVSQYATSGSYDLLALGFGEALLQQQPLVLDTVLTLYPDLPVTLLGPPPFNSDTEGLVSIEGSMGGVGRTGLADVTIQFQPVPEPGSLLLLGTGLLRLAGLGKRKLLKKR